MPTKTQVGLNFFPSRVVWIIDLFELRKFRKSSAYTCGENCQQKLWMLSPFMSSSVMEDQKIPDWVRNIFIWYGEKKISEDELIGAIQFLIKEGIIKI